MEKNGGNAAAEDRASPSEVAQHERDRHWRALHHVAPIHRGGFCLSELLGREAAVKDSNKKRGAVKDAMSRFLEGERRGVMHSIFTGWKTFAWC